jgi:hypothetical protein
VIDLDRLRPGQMAGRQSADLRRYVTNDVYPYSRLLRPRLDRAGLGQSGLRSVDDLQRIQPLQADEIGNGQTAVLEVTGDLIKSHAPLIERLRLRVADLTGTRAALARDRVEPAYKPIQWCVEGRMHLGMTATDLEQLGELGRRMLDIAGVRGDDRLVSIERPGSLAFWQLTLGCRAGGVLATHLGPDADARVVASVRPTVVAGSPSEVISALDGQTSNRVRLVIAFADPTDADVRTRLAGAAGGADVRLAWAPPGARALWIECERGELHTWPDAEVIEVVDPLTDKRAARGTDGELLWSALGWRGTVVMRFRTGTFGRLDPSPCTCGRTTPRLSLVALDPPFAALLDADPRVSRWCAVVGNGDRSALRLYVVPAARTPRGLATELGRELGAEVQLVRSSKLEALLTANGGDRVARPQ